MLYIHIAHRITFGTERAILIHTHTHTCMPHCMHKHTQTAYICRWFCLFVYVLCTNDFYVCGKKMVWKQYRTEQHFSGRIRASAHHCDVAVAAAVFLSQVKVRAIVWAQAKEWERAINTRVRVFVGCWASAGLMCIYVCT